MKIDDLLNGLVILKKYNSTFGMEVVNKQYSLNTNYAPTSDAYIVVECFDPYVSEEDMKTLRTLNWIGEQDGDVWCFRNF